MTIHYIQYSNARVFVLQIYGIQILGYMAIYSYTTVSDYKHTSHLPLVTSIIIRPYTHLQFALDDFDFYQTIYTTPICSKWLYVVSLSDVIHTSHLPLVTCVIIRLPVYPFLPSTLDDSTIMSLSHCIRTSHLPLVTGFIPDYMHTSVFP